MEAAYRNSPESKSKNPVPCRGSIVRSHTEETMSLLRESLTPATPKLSAAKAGAIAATLDDLVEMGLLETFVDEYRVRRYRPTDGRVA